MRSYVRSVQNARAMSTWSDPTRERKIEVTASVLGFQHPARSNAMHLPQSRRMPFCGSVTAASEAPMHFSAKPFELTKTKWGIFRTLLPDCSGNGGITADHIKRGGDPRRSSLTLSWPASLNAAFTDLSNYEIFMTASNFQFLKWKLHGKSTH